MRDFGCIQSPQNAYYIQLGLESLAVRMRRHCENAQKVAEYLASDDRIAWVNYPGLKTDPNHELAMKYCPNGTCGVLCFGVKGGRDASIKFMDSLEFATIATHVADAKTLLLHPASHTHRQLSDEQLLEAGIAPDLIRFSVGLEDPDDIINDIKQALDKIS
jgi:O-acetylhomoserine (thiol)-lyase